MSDYESRAKQFKDETGLLSPAKAFEPGSKDYNDRYKMWVKWNNERQQNR